MTWRPAPMPLLAVVVVGGAVALAGCAPEPVETGSERVSPSPPLAGTIASAQLPAPSRVVTLGDSLMAGSGLSAGEAWPDLLARSEDVSVTNFACGGMGFVVPGECGTTYAGLSPAIAALKPELIIVQSSSNDFWQDPDEIRLDTDDTVVELHDAAPEARIVGLSTIWNDDPEVPDDTATTSDALRDAIDSVGGTFIDVGQPLAGHPEWLQDDDIHPTAGGQTEIARAVASALHDADILP